MMMKTRSMCACQAAFLALVALASPVSAQTTSQLTAHNVKLESVDYLGKKAVKITEDGTVPNGEAYAAVKDAVFHNGARSNWNWGRPAAMPQQDGVLVASSESPFAFRTADSKASICARPTAAPMIRSRRNHSTQVQRAPRLSFAARPAGARRKQELRDLEPGVWTRYRITVDGTKARLYVHGASQPCLIVNDLKLGDSTGGVGLWIGPGTEGYFTGLDIKAVK
jgi:hypothetical protein